MSVYSREQTVRMFGKGELAYRETVLGGCASVEPCKSTPLDWMRLDCLESNCRNLVVGGRMSDAMNDYYTALERLKKRKGARINNDTVAIVLGYRENRKLFDAVQDGWSAHLSTLVTLALDCAVAS
ncbi:hypothetical protein [Paraburkholderia hospita]|uniref:hypothetical protein n=1 Tax=Paraburkholderia hospita TaxID=169430 RepID=UPI001F6249A6|nr:hypothetical protein [Paraburkholderia hospita]